MRRAQVDGVAVALAADHKRKKKLLKMRDGQGKTPREVAKFVTGGNRDKILQQFDWVSGGSVWSWKRLSHT